MSKGQIRKSQVITTFGPGALVDLPEHSVIIGGLNYWRYGEVPPKKIEEDRLAGLIRNWFKLPHVEFWEPPIHTDDFTIQKKGSIYANKFPTYFVTQQSYELVKGFKSRYLVHIDRLDSGKFFNPEIRKKVEVVPVRFVRACAHGHIGDINWRRFVHGDTKCTSQTLFFDEKGASGDLADVRVRCECGAQKRLIEATGFAGDNPPLDWCDARRPWIGPNEQDPDGCNQPNRLLVRSASNAYFPQVVSVISIPEAKKTVENAVERVWTLVSNLATPEELTFLKRIQPNVDSALKDFSSDDVMREIFNRKNGISTSRKPPKHAEIERFMSETDDVGTGILDQSFWAKSLPRSEWDAQWTKAMEKVVLVHRLKEVATQVGFTRFEAATPDISGDLDLQVKRASLTGDEQHWFPAYENRGEGFFIGFKKDVIKSWANRPEVKAREKVLRDGFDVWCRQHNNSHRTFAGMPYIMLHSLSHLLITSVSLECGYPASSLKERIYADETYGYGILIYTGTSDAEGTMGGLVEVGRSIKEHLRIALESGKLCSNDPVCVQHRPDMDFDHSNLLGAACHGCLLISETSCEMGNEFLDRTVVVPTLSQSGVCFFGEI
ncbi:MAG: DUF1998 domain-containing protein [Bdellovibrionales bacterium]|nr:DUF1998 domain-containing protein [Bdellovibrionales bacterium]